MDLLDTVSAALCSSTVWRDSLLNLHFSQVPGKKALLLDPKFSGPLGLVAEATLLKVNSLSLSLSH